MTETDPRFPSGRWIGFFLQRGFPGRQQMDLRLTFVGGRMTGEGRDWVGAFSIDGRYQLGDGVCSFCKAYAGKHEVFYRGFNEGKGIWGKWEIRPPLASQSGGFHIWPEGMSDPTNQELVEELDTPIWRDQSAECAEPELTPVG